MKLKDVLACCPGNPRGMHTTNKNKYKTERKYHFIGRYEYSKKEMVALQRIYGL
jgi:hypothetical protein